MKYTQDEAVKEILRRGKRIELRRSRAESAVLSGLSSLLAVSLLLTILLIPARSNQTAQQTALGSFLLSAEAGGYVLAAVLAFLLGAAVTLLIVRRQLKNRTNAKQTENNEEEIQQ